MPARAWLNGYRRRKIAKSRRSTTTAYNRLKASLPDMPIIINGGIASLSEAKAHLGHVDGVMLGRAAYQEPWRLLTADLELFGEAAPHSTMKDVFEAAMPYIETSSHGVRGCIRSRGISLAPFHGVQARGPFRRHLAENGVKPGAGVNVLRDAIALVDNCVAAPIAA